MAERDDDAVSAATEGERDVRLLAQPLSDLHLLTQAEKVSVLKILQDAIDIIPVLPQTSSHDLNDFLSATNNLLEEIAAEIDDTPAADPEDEIENEEPDENV
jgi:hypothetical protein